MEGKCGLNPPAQSGVAGQAGEVEPDESDEVSQGWCERGQALHELCQSGFTVVPVHPPPQHVLLAGRKPLRVVDVVHPRQLFAQVLAQALPQLGTGFADVVDEVAVLGFDGLQIDLRRSGGGCLEDGGGRIR